MKDTIDYYDKIGKHGLQASESRLGTNDDFATAQKLVRPGETVLDLACGYGRITAHLAKLGSEAYGIDISKVMINTAIEDAKKENLKNTHYTLGDMTELPYKSSFFNKVLCFCNSFTHLLTKAEQIACLTELRRVLKADGYALLVLPDPSDEPWKTKHSEAVDNIITCYRTIPEQLEPLQNRSFAHAEETIREVVCRSGFEDFTIECKPLNNGRRMVVNLFKCTAYGQQQAA